MPEFKIVKLSAKVSPDFRYTKIKILAKLSIVDFFVAKVSIFGYESHFDMANLGEIRESILISPSTDYGREINEIIVIK